jgi:hypothetical protein
MAAELHQLRQADVGAPDSGRLPCAPGTRRPSWPPARRRRGPGRARPRPRAARWPTRRTCSGSGSRPRPARTAWGPPGSRGASLRARAGTVIACARSRAAHGGVHTPRSLRRRAGRQPAGGLPRALQHPGARAAAQRARRARAAPPAVYMEWMRPVHQRRARARHGEALGKAIDGERARPHAGQAREGHVARGRVDDVLVDLVRQHEQPRVRRHHLRERLARGRRGLSAAIVCACCEPRRSDTFARLPPCPHRLWERTCRYRSAAGLASRPQ